MWNSALKWLWNGECAIITHGERYIILLQCSVYHDLGLDIKDTEDIVKSCLIPFPYLWASVDEMSVVVRGY